MAFPAATKKSAFAAGLLLAVLIVLLNGLKRRGVIPYDADSPELFPFVIVYFFVTVFVFVIDVRSITPKELKTKIPGVYFPTNKEGVHFILRVWGRMVFCFLGVTTGGVLLGSLALWLG